MCSSPPAHSIAVFRSVHSLAQLDAPQRHEHPYNVLALQPDHSPWTRRVDAGVESIPAVALALVSGKAVLNPWLEILEKQCHNM